MNVPLISILVPIYNVEKYIEKCARSIFEQTYSNIEAIFVDDCSPDDSIAILKNIIKEYPQREKNIHIITHVKNKGLSAARNSALLKSSGKYIMHIDSDDYVDYNIVEKLYNAIKDNDSDIAVCGIDFVYKHSVKSMIDDIPNDKYEYLNLLLSRRLSFNLVAKLIRREIVIKNNIFSIEGISHGEDLAVYPRIVYFSNKIVGIKDSLYYYDQHNINSLTNNINDKGINDIIYVVGYLKTFFENELPETKGKDLISSLIFFNICTLLTISPYRRYTEILNLYPRTQYYYNKKWPLQFKYFYFAISHKVNCLVYLFVYIRSWLKK